ncbi:hypothetical protein MTO96_004057 [Rhipicephalus appendiculatus]
MDLVKEFGDPRALLLEEDHIVLKLETPWPQGVAVPEGLSLVDDNGRLLVSKQRSLVLAAKNALPLGVRISKALFCGCAPFDSSEIYASAAILLLQDAEEICILHNKNNVYNLILMFPNVRVLALPHDLQRHALEESRGVPPFSGSQANVIGLPCGVLADDIALAAEYFPFIEMFEVIVGSLEALAKVSAFRHLRSLYVLLAPNIDLRDADSVLQRLLAGLPGLEKLRLERCGGLRLSAIAKLRPKLKYLRLGDCTGSMEDVPVDVDAFPLSGGPRDKYGSPRSLFQRTLPSHP